MNNVIYSINARGNGVLPLLEEYYKLDNLKIKNEICSCFECLIEALKNTGVKYNNFRTSLLPSNGNEHFEYLFVFRLIPDDNSIYEYIANNIVTLFQKNSNLNILIGDLILSDLEFTQQKLIIEKLFEILSKKIDEKWYAPYFLIYINNITREGINSINNFFTNKDFYLGCANLTFSSGFKSFISNYSVSTKYIKIGKNVFNADADIELDKHSDVHNGFWKWKENGYYVFGINDIIFNTFLKYKIDTLKGNLYSAEDFRYNKIYITTNENEKFNIKDINIDLKKYDYLEQNKQIFKQINVSKENFLTEIQNKIQQQAYYNIEILEEFNIIKFCIFLEFENKNKKIKKTLALKFNTELKEISIVSMY